VGAVLLVLLAAIVALGYGMMRGLGRPRGAAVRSLAGFVLFPPGCAHLSALLGRPLLAGFAPLAVAAALLPEEAFRELAREGLRRLASEREARPFAAVELDAAQRVVRARGLRVEEVLRPPAAADPAAASYCPLCSEQYRHGFDSCAECRVPLEPLAATAAL
jgi:hypothetical protein